MMKMKTKLTAALLILFLCTAVWPAQASAEASKSLGMSFSVFLTQMGVAYGRVKWGYSPERLDKDLIETPEGNYIAEYNDSIALFINMAEDGQKIKNAALSFILSPAGAGRPSLDEDGEEQYVGVCTQLIVASNLNMDVKQARGIITELGIFGPALDGRQRHVRVGKYVYIMKLHQTGAVILVVSTL